MADVAMPRLSDSMEEGTILKWLKSDGDEIQRGDELVEIETDKANMTYEADEAGTLSIVAQEGDTLPVGETIARIGEGAPASAEQPQADEPQAEQPAAEPESGEPQAEPEPEPAPQDAPREPEPAVATAEPERQEQPQAEEPGDEGVDGDGRDRVKASPIARRMAREIGLELAGLEGSGPGGRIVKADVEAATTSPKPGAAGDGPAGEAGVEAPAAEPEPAAAAAGPEPEPEPAKEEPAKEDKRPVPSPVVTGDQSQSGRGETTTQDLTRLQQTIARRMAESKATAPEFVLNTVVDMEEAVELRKQLKAAATDGPAPSFNDFVIKASALALRDFPRANGAYRDGKFELYSRVNIGIAVAAQDALVVPTVFDADRKSIGQIARDARALAERVRAGAITPPELSGGTFSISNLGMFGITSFVPVINPPQAAILGVGAMTPTPVALDGEVQIRNRMTLTLACDHRILYGADAAEFLGRIRELLESPLRLAL
jgi:pyruvate dehydrogenase E2 component (dihydrolipoamide acetyltransferase)